MQFSLFLISTLIGSGALALTCDQIPDSKIFAGSDFYFPGSDSKPTVLPTNFDCVYTIKAPVSSSKVLMARVQLTNQLKGQNDFITVTDSYGGRKTLNSQSQSFFEYEVFPGQPMTFHVTTKSVLSNSAFSLHVHYSQVSVGGSQALATGNTMNFMDLGKIGMSSGRQNSLTYTSNEEMSVYLAVNRADYPLDYLERVYVVDGDIFNQAKVSKINDLVYYQNFVSTTKKITLVSFQNSTYPDTAVVINRMSEVSPLALLKAEVSPTGHESALNLKQLNGENVVEVVAAQGKQILVRGVTFNGKPDSNCVAQIVSGAPNKSSSVLFDLYKNQSQLPKTFDVNNFSVIGQNCGFTVKVITPFSSI